MSRPCCWTLDLYKKGGFEIFEVDRSMESIAVVASGNVLMTGLDNGASTRFLQSKKSGGGGECAVRVRVHVI